MNRPADACHLEALRDRYNAGEPLKFVHFWGHRPPRGGVGASCFSQWYEAPFELDGERYPTADPNRWRGLNLLGFALMAVRAERR